MSGLGEHPASRGGEEGVSVVIPALNEAGAIASTIRSVREVLERTSRPFEVVVVDDGSTDGTGDIARREGADVVWSLPENQGYGAALKAGIARARYDLIVIIDADGSYPIESIPVLLERAAAYDMVVGARTGKSVAIPIERKPAKWVLGRLASYLAGRQIPDVNSGLRVMRRELVKRFEHLLPSGFSFTTTITLAALCNGYLVYYHPIDYHPRIGESKIRPVHAFEFLLLIIRTIVYFNPLKVFLPMGAVFFIGGFLKFIYDLFLENLSETAIMGLLTAAILWGVGLLADQISRLGLRNTP
jgi:glycosyltransferase involved in cell wall biosynthesis